MTDGAAAGQSDCAAGPFGGTGSAVRRWARVGSSFPISRASQPAHPARPLASRRPATRFDWQRIRRPSVAPWVPGSPDRRAPSQHAGYRRASHAGPRIPRPVRSLHPWRGVGPRAPASKSTTSRCYVISILQPLTPSISATASLVASRRVAGLHPSRTHPFDLGKTRCGPSSRTRQI